VNAAERDGAVWLAQALDLIAKATDAQKSDADGLEAHQHGVNILRTLIANVEGAAIAVSELAPASGAAFASDPLAMLTDLDLVSDPRDLDTLERAAVTIVRLRFQGRRRQLANNDVSKIMPPAVLAPVVVVDLCGQQLCTENATHRMAWPGSPPSLVCAAHGQKAKATAEALGFDVNLQPLGWPS
jgi:hypothetical protein